MGYIMSRVYPNPKKDEKKGNLVMGSVVKPDDPNDNVIPGRVVEEPWMWSKEGAEARQRSLEMEAEEYWKKKTNPKIEYNLPDDREEGLFSQIIWFSLESVLNAISLPFYIVYCIATFVDDMLDGIDGGGKGNNDTRNMYLIVKNMKSGQIEFLKLDEIPEEQKEKIIKYLDETPRLEATIEGKGSELQIKDLNGDIMDTLPHDKPVCVENPNSIETEQFLGKILEQNKDIWVRKDNDYHNSLISQPVGEVEWQEKDASTAKKVIEYVTSQEEPYEYVTIVQKLSKEGGRKQTKHKKKSKTKKRSN